VRQSLGGYQKDCVKFKQLGMVTRVDDVQQARFILNKGDFVLCDQAKLHKNLGPDCLDAGLRMGIGLTSHVYPLPEKQAKNYKLCTACCYSEGTARLHFDELNEEGVAAYRPWQEKPIKGKFATALALKSKAKAKAKSKVKKEPGKAVKEEPGLVTVKKEPGVAELPAAKRAKVKTEVPIKQEPGSRPVGRPSAAKSLAKPPAKKNELAQSVLQAMEKGQKMAVVTKYGIQQPCTITDTTTDRVKFHYDGFGDQFDEWLDKTSDRIIEVKGEDTSAPRSPGPSEEHKEDQRVLLAMSNSPTKPAPAKPTILSMLTSKSSSSAAVVSEKQSSAEGINSEASSSSQGVVPTPQGKGVATPQAGAGKELMGKGLPSESPAATDVVSTADDDEVIGIDVSQ